MRKTFETENGTTIEFRVTELERVNVTGKIVVIPKGASVVAENKTKGIRYEYVNTEELKKADFDFKGRRPTNSQRELKKLILREGFPYRKEVGNFWAGVPDMSDSDYKMIFISCDELVGWAEMFDKENGSEMGNIHQYALYLASRVKAEGWEAVADKADRIYKRYRIIKDYRAKSGFSIVGGCSACNDYISASDVLYYDYNDRYQDIVAWVVLSK